MRSLLIAGLCLLGTVPGQNSAFAQKTAKPKPRKPLELTSHRSYRLHVQKVNSRIWVRMERQWEFKTLPAEIVESIRKHPHAKPLGGGKGKKAKGAAIRWKPNKKGVSALFWFFDGPKAKLVGVSIDLILDRKGPKQPESVFYNFDGLRVAADVENARLTAVTWNKRKLPNASRKSAGLIVDNAAEIDAMGTLTEKSSRALEAADGVFSGDVLQKLRALAWSDLTNNSHHGITLGWLGHEHLRHNLFLLPGKPGQPFAFRYRVSGKSVPLKLVRRQLGDDGWPMVLSGKQYVGQTTTGLQILRPVEFVLSKQRPKTRKKPKPKR